MEICNAEFDIAGNPEFKLQLLIETNIRSVVEDISEITDGADKQLKIEQQLGIIKIKWDSQEFSFQEWRGRGIYALKGAPLVMEELEESVMNMQTMLTVRHVAPFRAFAHASLSETLPFFISCHMCFIFYHIKYSCIFMC